jgi:alpha-L-arabinofuranosidase
MFKNTITKSFGLSVMATCFATGAFAQTPKLTLDLSKPGLTVSPMLYGQMTEEINHAYDGGLYADICCLLFRKGSL